MNKGTTQFWVAILATGGLVGITAASLFAGADQRVGDMLVGGLLMLTGSSGSWLFRLNGYASGEADRATAVAAMHQDNLGKLASIQRDLDSLKENRPQWPPPPSAS